MRGGDGDVSTVKLAIEMEKNSASYKYIHTITGTLQYKYILIFIFIWFQAPCTYIVAMGGDSFTPSLVTTNATES